MLAAETRMAKVLAAPPPILKAIDDLLLGKAKIDTPAQNDDSASRTCTQREAAHRLGVSYSTVHRMVKSGKLLRVVINTQPRILLSSIISVTSLNK